MNINDWVMAIDGSLFYFRKNDPSNPIKLNTGNNIVKSHKTLTLFYNFNTKIYRFFQDENDFLHLITYTPTEPELGIDSMAISRGFQVVDYDVDFNGMLYIITVDGKIKVFDVYADVNDEILEYHPQTPGVTFTRFVCVGEIIIVIDSEGNIWGNKGYAEKFGVIIDDNELFQITRDILFVNACYSEELSLMLTDTGELYVSGFLPSPIGRETQLSKFAIDLKLKSVSYEGSSEVFAFIDKNDDLYYMFMKHREPIRLIKLYEGVESSHCTDRSIIFTTKDRKVMVVDMNANKLPDLENITSLDFYGQLPNVYENLALHRFHKTKSARKLLN